jgi:radical SAM-linked protein
MSSPAAPTPVRTRVRIRFSKLGKVRFTSHRDTARIWERALRRADVPVAYSEGFSPRPRLHFGLALSTGHESLGEYLDVDLDFAADSDRVQIDAARFDLALPVGFTAQGTTTVEPGTASLQEAVNACTWRMEVIGAAPGVVGAAVEQLLDADRLVVTRERKGKDVTEDLRPALLELALAGPTPSGTELHCELATQPRALRPGDVLGAIADLVPGATPGRVCRTHQWLDAHGDRREPVPAPPGLEAWSLAAVAEASPPAPAPLELRAS